MEPTELRILLPQGGMWPASLVDITIDDDIGPERAAYEVASASRRFRQGVRTVLRGLAMFGYPDEEAVTIEQRWRRARSFLRDCNRDLLPAEGETMIRWTPGRKCAVLAMIHDKEISREVAKARFGLSDEEIDGWKTRLERFGLDGLSTTQMQRVGRVVSP